MKTKFLLLFLSLFAFVGGVKAQNWIWKTETAKQGEWYLYNFGNKKFVTVNDNGAPVASDIESASVFTISGLNNTDLAYKIESNQYYLYQASGDFGKYENKKKVSSGRNGTSVSSITSNYGQKWAWYIKTYSVGYQIYSNHEYSSILGSWQHRTESERYITCNGDNYSLPKNKDEYNTSNATFFFISQAQINAYNAYITAWNNANNYNNDPEKRLTEAVQTRLSNALGASTNYASAPTNTEELQNALTDAQNCTAAYNDTNYGIRNVHFNDDIYFWETDGDGFYIKEDATDSRLHGRVAECWVDGNSTEKNTKTASIYQVVSGLPAGYYTLSANCIGGHGDTQDYLFVTVGEQTYSSIVPGVDGDPSTIATSVTFYTDGSDVTVGFMKNGTQWWSAFDDVTLTPENNFQTIYTRSNLYDGRYGTICLPYAVKAEDLVGATAYRILGKRVDENGAATSIVFDEVDVLEAGVPYIFIAEQETITATYSMGAKALAGKSNNGLYGKFALTYFKDELAAYNEEKAKENGGYYVITSSNKIQKASDKSGVGANCAFIKMSEVPVYTDEEEGATEVKIMREDLETGLDAVEMNSARVVYDLQGRRVAQPAQGLYIVNGKKMYIK